MTTFTAFAIALFLVALSMGVYALFLGWGVRWAKKQRVSFGQVFTATCLITFIEMPVSLGITTLLHEAADQAPLLAIGSIVFRIALHLAIIAYVFQLSVLRAVQAWIVSIFSCPIPLLFAIFIIRPYLIEAYVSPSNGMAPTLLGTHWKIECPNCGSDAFCTPPAPEQFGQDIDRLMICGQDLKAHPVPKADHEREVYTGDRFLVSKLIKLQRFDVIVFQYPAEPKTNYVKRLVGLPGETLFIREGQLWIDGKPIALPDSIKGLEYTDSFERFGDTIWGHSSNPVTLGADEYFVLGDFSAQSMDSRLWRSGAPGYAPYAVPESYVLGVVTHIYWPPERWRILR